MRETAASAVRRDLLVDYLDLFSLGRAARLGLRRRRLLYLRSSPRRAVRVVVAILRHLGVRIERAQSCHGGATRNNAYFTAGEALRALLLDMVEPRLARRLAGVALANGEQRQRVVRSLVLAFWGRGLHVVEAIETAGRAPARERPIVLLERAVFSDVIALFAHRRGVDVRFYRAPPRLTLERRPGYWADTLEVPRGRATVIAIRNALAGLTFAALALLLGRARWPPGARFDVIALSARDRPASGLDDLYWLAPLKARRPVRVLLAHSGSDPAGVRAHYGSALDGIVWSNPRALFQPQPVAFHRAPPLAYGRAVLRGLGLAAKGLFSGVLSPWMAGELIRLYERVAFFDALIVATGARVGWSTTESHDLGTQALAIALSGRGGLTFGTAWSLKGEVHVASSTNRNDAKFLWGAHQADIFRAAGALTSRIVLAGYPATRRAWSGHIAAGERPPWLARGLTLAPEGKVICFYDNAFGVDLVASREEMRKLYGRLLALIESDPELSLVIKAKRSVGDELGAEVAFGIERMVQAGRVLVRSEPGDLEAGLAADAVIGVGLSTLACLAAALGVPAVLYDPIGSAERFSLTHEGLFAVHRLDEVEKALGRALGMSRRPRLGVGGRVDQFGDLDGDRRCADYLAWTLDALDKGAGANAALAVADSAYAATHGPSTIIPGRSPEDGVGAANRARGASVPDAIGEARDRLEAAPPGAREAYA